ncbi:MAG: hypothetical protein GC185_10670 [Alphaproteobacteria bacterium]|nr:hypothetical protein [Alphaproteobacteria bacterium]
MTDYTTLNEGHLLIISGFMLFIALHSLGRNVLFAFASDAVSARWVGRRPARGKNKPQQVLELHLPDGSTARASVETSLRLYEELSKNDGRISRAAVSRIYPAGFRLAGWHDAAADWLRVVLPFAVLDYFYAVRSLYAFRPTLYIFETACFALAIGASILFAARERTVPWKRFREQREELEKQKDADAGPPDTGATFDAGRLADDLRESQPAFFAHKGNLIFFFILLLLPVSDIFFMSPGAFVTDPALTPAVVVKTDYKPGKFDTCDMTVRFYLDTANLFDYARAEGEGRYVPAHQLVRASMFSPYCHVGDRLTLGYDRLSQTRGSAFVYTRGWLQFAVMLEAFCALLAFLYFRRIAAFCFSAPRAGDEGED